MMPGLGGIGDAWLGWIAAVSLQLVPLTLVALLLDRLLQRLGPSVRSAVWWVVLIKLVLPPGLTSPLAPFLPVVPFVPVVPVVPVVQVVQVVSHEALAAVMDQAAVRTVDHTLRHESTAAVAAIAAFALWLAGMAAVGIVARGRYRRVRACCLAGSHPAPPDVMDLAHDAARRLRLRTLPPVRVCDDIDQPAVVGFLAPVVILPRALAAPPAAGGHDSRPLLEHVLLHELAHVRRGDPIASLIALAAQMVFWFHPAIWCARRRLATLREMACDRAVARTLGPAAPGYRRTLLVLARSTAAVASGLRDARPRAIAGGISPAGAPGTLGLFQRRAQIVARLDALARPLGMGRRTEQLAATAIALGVLVSCAPLASPRPPPPAPVSTRTETAALDIPSLDRLPGSLQKRYAVMRAMALEAQSVEKGTTHPRE